MPRARWVALALAGLLGVAIDSLPPTVHDTSALFAGVTAPRSHRLGGGSFSPAVAPAVTRTARGVNVFLTWPAVTFSSGASPSYVVTRFQTDGTQVSVCTGADAPVVSAGTASCTDKKPQAGSLYSQQPVLLAGGQVTWSLPPSIPA